MLAIAIVAAVVAVGPGGAALAAAHDGVVVEEVAKNGAADRAGLTAGDRIESWSRGGRSGAIASPFDLVRLELELGRGRILSLHGHRGRQPRTWGLAEDRWRIETRPGLLDAALHGLCQTAGALAAAGKPAEAARLLDGAAARATEPAWLAPWLGWQAAALFEKADQRNLADAAFTQAIARGKRAGPLVGSMLLQKWAAAALRRGDWVAARGRYEEALADAHRADADPLFEAAVVHRLGSTAYDRDERAAAERLFRRALALQKVAAPGSLAVASTLDMLGLVVARGNPAAAVGYHHEAVAIKRRRLPGTETLSDTLYNAGVTEWKLGDLAQAEAHFKEALSLQEKFTPDGVEVADTLDTMSLVAGDRGDLVKASEYSARAVQIYERREPGTVNYATILNNAAQIAERRGELDEAESGYLRALAIKEKLAPGTRVITTTLHNLGNVLQAKGALDEARRYYLRSLAIREKLAAASEDVASVLCDLGLLAQRQGDARQAEGHYRRALGILEKVAPRGVDMASALLGLGTVSATAGDLGQAEAFHRRALELRQAIAPGSAEHADVLAALAGVVRRKGRADEAARLYRRALDALDHQLAHLGGTREVRSRFRAGRTDYHREYVDLLVERGRAGEAFAVIERSRARTLLETLAEAGVDIRHGVDPRLLEGERDLRRSLAARSELRLRLLTEGARQGLPAVERDITRLIAEHREAEEQIRTSSPAYAGLTQPRPLPAAEVQRRLLDRDTLLLEYSLGTERSQVVAVSWARVSAYELPGRAVIESAARRLHELLAGRVAGGAPGPPASAPPAPEYAEAAQTLSRMVLGPLAELLEDRRLVIVSDGALQFIPFAALPEPSRGQPLIVRHEIVHLPSASVLAEVRRKAAARQERPSGAVAVIADPVFTADDPRLARPPHDASAGRDPAAADPPSARRLLSSLRDVGMVEATSGRGGLALPRLPFSGREAEAILALVPPAAGMKAVGFRASRETARGPELGRYRIVHFATHGLLDSHQPELSGLVLSMIDEQGRPRNGFLDLQDIYNLDLPVELVVLSACETALGKEVSGEGLIGLTRGFMYAGAARVVASLWKVDDLATAELMTRFYRSIEKGGLAPAAALRRAQLELLADPDRASPRHWAAFELQGDWR